MGSPPARMGRRSSLVGLQAVWLMPVLSTALVSSALSTPINVEATDPDGKKYATMTVLGSHFGSGYWEGRFRIQARNNYQLDNVKTYPIYLQNGATWGDYQDGAGVWKWGTTFARFDGETGFEVPDSSWEYINTFPDAGKAYPYINVGSLGPGESAEFTWHWDWTNYVAGGTYVMAGDTFAVATLTREIPEPTSAFLAILAALGITVVARRRRA